MVLAVTPCQVVRVFTAQSGGDDVGVNFEIGAPSQLDVAELRPVELALVRVVLVHGVLPLVHGERETVSGGAGEHGLLGGLRSGCAGSSVVC